jgi:NAD(P)-dependent dehydrogenase (short-subunit alcohol dehydrogenase family)
VTAASSPVPELAGRTVLVTGGSRGIGRAIVHGALARGACVAYCSRRPADDERSGYETARLRAVRADVAREEDVDSFFQEATGAFGPPDVVVSNAGVSETALLVGCETRTFDALLATNLTGAFLVARAALRAFGDRGGVLVFVGSIQEQGSPRGAAAYAAGKGGLAGLVERVARDHGPRGVRANQVVTGFVDTDLTRDLPEVARRRVLEMVPLRRLASVEEVAALALFLASARAAGLNGVTLHASGGLREMYV